MINLEYTSAAFFLIELLLFSALLAWQGLLWLANSLEQAWWAKVDTCGPNVTYWFGPFLTRKKLIKEIDNYLTYILPDNLLGKIWKGKFKGQKQKWFIVKFIGNDSEININTKYPEFLDWKWIDLDKLTNTVVDFKLEVYNKIKSEIKEIIN